MTKCLVCPEAMDPVNIEHGTHPGCDLKLLSVTEDEDPFAAMIKREIMDMVKWADNQNPRTHQQAIGPSEVGSLCDRRLGYRLSGIPKCNVDFDPWPSIMGTAIHSWLDASMQAYMRNTGSQAWLTETRVKVSEFVHGRADLYQRDRKSVVDYKTAGPDVMRKVAKEGPPIGYQIQLHVYGLGFEQMGHPVEKVCLVFLPRAGWLKDTYVWCADYNRDVALGAMVRLQEIAQQILDLDILMDGNSHRWEQIEATPGNECGFCPWYDPGRDAERGADATGCPGR